MELGVVARGQGGDPAKAGLVDDLDLSGGNVTGLYGFNAGLEVKRLELLPTAGTIGILLNLGKLPLHNPPAKVAPEHRPAMMPIRHSSW